MKLTNANKYLAIVFLFFYACTHRSEQSLLIGQWQYRFIGKGDSSFYSISDEDRLSLSADSSFEYLIIDAKKYKTGIWYYQDHILHLKYKNPDTLRKFEVRVITENILNIQEGEMRLNLERIK